MKKHIASPRSDRDDQQVDRWKYRRRAVFGSLWFSAAVIVYLMTLGVDDGLRKEIAHGILEAETWVLLGYTLGAIVDDNLRTGQFGANFFRHKMDSNRDRGADPDSDAGVDGDSSAQQSDDHHGA